MPENAPCSDLMRDLVQPRASFTYDYHQQQPGQHSGEDAPGLDAVAQTASLAAFSSYVYDAAVAQDDGTPDPGEGLRGEQVEMQ